MVRNRAELERTLTDVIQEYHHICWCPSSNNYPALYYLSQLYYNNLGIAEDNAPDLFVISDLRPPVNMGFYAPKILGTGNWQNAAHIYPEPDVYSDGEYTGIPFSVDVISIERLEDLHLKKELSMGMDEVRQSVSRGWKVDLRGMVNTDGRCFYMHVSVRSGETVSETDLIYVFADPLHFATDFLLAKNINTHFVAYAAYQEGIDGLETGSWLYSMIPILKPKYLLANTKFLQNGVLVKDRPVDEELNAMWDALEPWRIYTRNTYWTCRSTLDSKNDEDAVPWISRTHIKQIGFYEVDEYTLPDVERSRTEARIEHTGDTIRIYFPSKPTDEIRTALKGRGFRYDPENRSWYAPANTDNVTFIEQLIQET